MHKRYGQVCPVARTLDVVGGRWTLLIIRDLFLGKRRFNEFLDNSPGLSPKLLSERLKHLIEKEIVTRRVHSEFPPRSEYELTERGVSLAPVVLSLVEWGLENLFEGEDDAREEVAARIDAAVGEFSA